MTAYQLLGMGLLIALLLPSLVALSDRYRLHDLFRGLLAMAGLLYCWMTGGVGGLLQGFASGVSALVLLAGLVACTQNIAETRLLSGGEIKQLSAGAAWLSPPVAAIYLALALFLGLGAGGFGRKFHIFHRHEGLATISSMTLVATFAAAG